MTDTSAQRFVEQLATHDNPVNWETATRLGAELVDHPDTSTGAGFHLANGDLVYPTSDGWAILEQVRTGIRIRSGQMERVHSPGIHPTARVHPSARIHPTACIEAGATIGPRTVINEHVHVGRNSHVGKLSFVCAGAFIGAGATVNLNCILGEGAVIGAGSYIGSSTKVGHGATVPQQSTLAPFSTIGNHDRHEQHRAARNDLGRNAPQLAHAIERLLAMDPD